MSAQVDVPKYTYLKRGVYYFVRRIPSDLQTFYRTDRIDQLNDALNSGRTKHYF